MVIGNCMPFEDAFEYTLATLKEAQLIERSFVPSDIVCEKCDATYKSSLNNGQKIIFNLDDNNRHRTNQYIVKLCQQCFAELHSKYTHSLCIEKRNGASEYSEEEYKKIRAKNLCSDCELIGTRTLVFVVHPKNTALVIGGSECALPICEHRCNDILKSCKRYEHRTLDIPGAFHV